MDSAFSFLNIFCIILVMNLYKMGKFRAVHFCKNPQTAWFFTENGS